MDNRLAKIAKNGKSDTWTATKTLVAKVQYHRRTGHGPIKKSRKGRKLVWQPQTLA